MAKLYESRNENFNCPLTKDEEGFVFESDNININSLVQCKRIVSGFLKTYRNPIARFCTLTFCSCCYSDCTDHSPDRS